MTEYKRKSRARTADSYESVPSYENEGSVSFPYIHAETAATLFSRIKSHGVVAAVVVREKARDNTIADQVCERAMGKRRNGKEDWNES